MASDHRPIVAIDPGRDKCGIAALDAGRGLAEKIVVPTPDLPSALAEILLRHADAHVVIGDGTGSSDAQAAVLARSPELELCEVAEHHSTERALERWRDAVSGWRRLLPRSLRFPPGPIDDFAAWVLAEEYAAGLDHIA